MTGQSILGQRLLRSGDGTHERRLKSVSALPLLIPDDFGLKPTRELICERYEKASLISARTCGLPHPGFPPNP